jgi:hypothetical protein
MKRPTTTQSVVLRLPALLLAFWSLAAAGADSGTTAVSITETIDGSDGKKITLIQHAVDRLDIQLSEIRSDALGQLTIPYAALWYDQWGATWVYINPEPRVFLRDAVEVVSISDDVVFLASGPSVGTPVVIVGAAELHGIESGVGH